MGRLQVHVRLDQSAGKLPGTRHRVLLDSIEPGGGPWRRVMSATKTSCGEQINKYYYALIDESLEGDLCKNGCFTPLELEHAAEMIAIENRRRAEESVRFEAERAEHSRQLEIDRERRREEIRRFKTGETAPIEKPDPEGDQGK